MFAADYAIIIADRIILPYLSKGKRRLYNKNQGKAVADWSLHWNLFYLWPKSSFIQNFIYIRYSILTYFNLHSILLNPIPYMYLS